MRGERRENSEKESEGRRGREIGLTTKEKGGKNSEKESEGRRGREIGKRE